MNKFHKITAVCFICLISFIARAEIEATPTELAEVACPDNWQNLDITIDPASVSWGGTTDKNDFLEFQDDYFIEGTKSWGDMDDRYADDALTVASECVLRKNIVVDNYFNKTIDTSTILRARINIVPFIMGLLL